MEEIAKVESFNNTEAIPPRNAVSVCVLIAATRVFYGL